jgi:Domain of unknown function (DUF5753)
MTRQEIFERKHPPRSWLIIFDSALLRMAASPATMRG